MKKIYNKYKRNIINLRLPNSFLIIGVIGIITSIILMIIRPRSPLPLLMLLSSMFPVFAYVASYVLTEYYVCDFQCVKLFFCGIKIKKYKYRNYKGIAIVNARSNFNAMLGPITYTIKDPTGKRKHIVFPYIIFLKPDFSISHLHKSMSNGAISYTSSIGLCWFDALGELLAYTDFNIYVLEDVYLRFKGKFDELFQNKNYDISRFIIIGEQEIAYSTYIDL